MKLPEGHNVHAPADAPPQPLRYRPAEHDEAEQVEQTEAPGPSSHNHFQASVHSNSLRPQYQSRPIVLCSSVVQGFHQDFELPQSQCDKHLGLWNCVSNSLKQSTLIDYKQLSTHSPRLPDETLKLPEGHDTHAPADAPLQPLRYWPATHDEAEQVEQTENPVRSIRVSSRSTTGIQV